MISTPTTTPSTSDTAVKQSRCRYAIALPPSLSILWTRSDNFAEPQVIPHQAEACPRAEAEPPHPSVDPPEDRQHHQVRHAIFAFRTAYDDRSTRRNGGSIHQGRRLTATGTTPSDDIGARPVSVSRRLARAPFSIPAFITPFFTANTNERATTGIMCDMVAVTGASFTFI
jgi:hypothetical protein